MRPLEHTKAAIAVAAAAIESMRSEVQASPACERQKRMLLRCAIHDLELRYRRLVDLQAILLLHAPTDMFARHWAEFFACYDKFVRAERSLRLDADAASVAFDKAVCAEAQQPMKVAELG